MFKILRCLETPGNVQDIEVSLSPRKLCYVIYHMEECKQCTLGEESSTSLSAVHDGSCWVRWHGGEVWFSGRQEQEDNPGELPLCPLSDFILFK